MGHHHGGGALQHQGEGGLRGRPRLQQGLRHGGVGGAVPGADEEGRGHGVPPPPTLRLREPEVRRPVEQ